MPDDKKQFIGRKLYIKWGEHMYIAIEKVPCGDKKLLEMELNGGETLLCNLFEDKETGKIIEESLGLPSNGKSGYELQHFFLQPEFWMTPGEKLTKENHDFR